MLCRDDDEAAKRSCNCKLCFAKSLLNVRVKIPSEILPQINSIDFYFFAKKWLIHTKKVNQPNKCRWNDNFIGKVLLPSINKLPLTSFRSSSQILFLFTLKAIHAQIEIQNYWFTAVNYRHVSCINIILQKEEENYERGMRKNS